MCASLCFILAPKNFTFLLYYIYSKAKLLIFGRLQILESWFVLSKSKSKSRSWKQKELIHSVDSDNDYLAKKSRNYSVITNKILYTIFRLNEIFFYIIFFIYWVQFSSMKFHKKMCFLKIPNTVLLKIDHSFFFFYFFLKRAIAWLVLIIPKKFILFKKVSHKMSFLFQWQ
jgi:hypothetical protein